MLGNKRLVALVCAACVICIVLCSAEALRRDGGQQQTLTPVMVEVQERSNDQTSNNGAQSQPSGGSGGAGAGGAGAGGAAAQPTKIKHGDVVITDVPQGVVALNHPGAIPKPIPKGNNPFVA